MEIFLPLGAVNGQGLQIGANLIDVFVLQNCTPSRHGQRAARGFSVLHCLDEYLKSLVEFPQVRALPAFPGTICPSAVTYGTYSSEPGPALPDGVLVPGEGIYRGYIFGVRHSRRSINRNHTHC